MDESSFLVLLHGLGIHHPFKHFGMYRDAQTYAAQAIENPEADRAEIYRVRAQDARDALAVYQSGKAELVAVVCVEPSEQEIWMAQHKARENAWEASDKGPQAILRYLGL